MSIPQYILIAWFALAILTNLLSAVISKNEKDRLISAITVVLASFLTWMVVIA